MLGDSVDSIRGIPGVGEKTASKLVQQYGSMEGLYDHTDELKGKLKEKVEANREQAFMSKSLATIILDAPVEFNEKELLIEEMDKEKLHSLFSDLEFRTLSKRILSKDIGSVKHPYRERKIRQFMNRVRINWVGIITQSSFFLYIFQ